MQKNNYKNNKNYRNSGNQVFDSNGPTGRLKGNAKSISEKYMSMARDAYASGDYILMETLYQHAEHYFRINNYLNDQADQKRKNRNDREEKIEAEENSSSVETNNSDGIEILTDLSIDEDNSDENSLENENIETTEEVSNSEAPRKKSRNRRRNSSQSSSVEK